MIWYKTANNVTSFLSSAISSGSWSLIVNDWWIFPSTFPYLLTLESQLNGETTTREIVKVTAKDWNTLTIERAVEECVSDDTANPKTFSQLAHSFEAWSVVSLCFTAWTYDDLKNWIIDQANRITATNNEITTLTGLINNLEDDIHNL